MALSKKARKRDEDSFDDNSVDSQRKQSLTMPQQMQMAGQGQLVQQQLP